MLTNVSRLVHAKIPKLYAQIHKAPITVRIARMDTVTMARNVKVNIILYQFSTILWTIVITQLVQASEGPCHLTIQLYFKH